MIPLAREIGSRPDPIPASDEVVLGLAITAEVAGIVLAIAIWRARDRSLTAKLLWTFVALLPVVGVLAYVVWGDPPPPVGPTDRPTRRNWE